MNLYGMVENDSLNWVDLLGFAGLMPRTPERQSDDLDRAIHEGGQEAQRASERNKRENKHQDGGKEYCGFICSRCVKGVTTYERTKAVQGWNTSCVPSRFGNKCPDGTNTVAVFHNHPPNNQLSDDDIKNARRDKIRVGATRTNRDKSTTTDVFDPATDTRINVNTPAPPPVPTQKK